MAPIRVLLVDDHQLVRQGIRSILEQDESIVVVGEASDAEESIIELERSTPEIILLDISLPTMNGVELAKLIKSKFPDVRIIVLTMHSDDEYVRGMLLAGADGYLLKHSSAHELLDAIRLVLNDRMLYPKRANSLVGELQSSWSSSTRQNNQLTERELEILQLIAAGRTSREIAKEIFLSVKTVDNYRARILAKLQARNTAEAVSFAIQKGLTSSPLDAGMTSLQAETVQ